MAEWGAFAFGVVLGWFVYFTNRYRKGEVQFSDLTTLLGVIGGGAVTALFGEAKTALFGAYGMGLAVGFFAYFLALMVLVKLSGGVFTATWFLDGRRKQLAENETFGETRPTVAPMAVQLEGPQQAMATAARSPLCVAVDGRDRAMAALSDVLRDLMRRISDRTDAADRSELQEAHLRLTQKHDELATLRLKDLPDSESVRVALARLDAITAELVADAQEMKTTTNAPATAAKMIDRASRVIGFLGAMFA
ncbi:MAG: hypothetical protein ABIX00_04130 [Polaromonas sp.]